MRTLLIMRHAKSSWDNPDWSDFDRPLNTRGLTTTPFMGNVIYENGLAPELIVSSPAKRAKQTAVLIKETTQVNASVMYDERIYEASPGSLMAVLSEFPETADSVMLVGHNPGLEGLLRVLTGEVEVIPTAAVAKITLDIGNWADVRPDCGKLEVLMRPKELIQRVDL